MLERKREIVAVKAIREEVEKERIEKQKANAANQHQEPSVKKLTQPKDDNSSRAQAKVAQLFNTNRTYVNQAVKAIREEVEKERLEKQKANAANQHKDALQQKIVATQTLNRNVTDTKIAKLFNTNRTYVNQAVKAIREEVAKNVGGRPKKEDKKPGQKIVQVSKDEHATKTAHKVAQLFNTSHRRKTTASFF